MPIKGLDEISRPKIVGTIRLGVKEKTKSGKEYPKSTPHFVLRDAPDLIPIYGEKPTTIRILFFQDNIDEVLPHFLKRYQKSGLRCMGDGETVLFRTADEPEPVFDRRGKETGKEYPRLIEAGVVSRDHGSYRTGEVMKVGQPATGECRCHFYESRECRDTGRLLFAVRDNPRLGLYQMTIHKRALTTIKSQLELALHWFGSISAVPWELHLWPETVKIGGADMTIFTPWVEVDREWLQQKLARLEERKAAGLLGEGPAVEGRGRVVEQEIVEPANGYDHDDLEPPHPEMMDQGEIEEAEAELDEADIEELAAEVEDAPIGPGESDLDPETLAELERIFLEEVVESTGYYNAIPHVRNAMAKLGLEYDPDREEELMVALQGYASKRADEKAAEEEKGKKGQAKLPLDGGQDWGNVFVEGRKVGLSVPQVRELFGVQNLLEWHKRDPQKHTLKRAVEMVKEAAS